MGSQCQFSRKGHVEINCIKHFLIYNKNFLLQQLIVPYTVFLKLVLENMISYFSVSSIQCPLLLLPNTLNDSGVLQEI